MQLLRSIFDVQVIVRMRSGDFVVQWDGRFDRIRGELDAQTRTIQVVVAVDKPYEGVVPGNRPNRFRILFDGLLDQFRERVLGPAIDTALRWRYLSVGCVGGLILVSVSLMAGGVIKFQAFPELDGDVVVARVVLPPGTPLDGPITFTESGTVIIDAAADINSLGAVSITGGQISTAGDIVTNGHTVELHGPVTLTGNVAINTQLGSGNGANLTFWGTLDGAAALTLTTGTNSGSSPFNAIAFKQQVGRGVSARTDHRECL